MNLEKLNKILIKTLNNRIPEFSDWDKDNNHWSSILDLVDIERTNDTRPVDGFVFIRDPMSDWRRSSFYYLKIPKEIAEKILVLGDLP